MLIVFEGIDKSGKTTGLKTAEQYLENNYNFDIDIISEVGSQATGLGAIIRDLISRLPLDDETQFYLISAVRSYMKHDLSELNKTKVILMDRYYLSTLVYQSDIPKYLDKARPFARKSLYDEIILNTTVPIDGLMYFEPSIDILKQRLDEAQNLDNLEYKIKQKLPTYLAGYNYYIKDLPGNIPVVRINSNPNNMNVKNDICNGIDLILREHPIRR